MFNIQKYSLHDGPGIRTTVFLKGCPLCCPWCHNPESQKPEPEVIFFETRCVGCGSCVKVCPAGVAGNKGGSAKCTACGLCVQACAYGAREVVGKSMSADEVMSEVLRDRIFYDQSGGGVTFSGGEPMMQPEFLRELLLRCRAEGLRTTVDTSGFAAWEAFEAVVPLVDVFLYDVK
ncbi:MAG: glycyl-radical enzyme activating protein, partial [Bacillota bacterium]